MTDSPFRPVIRTQSDLQQAWRRLMGPWSFSGPSIWMMLIEDDAPIPQITEISEATDPFVPGDGMEGFVDLLRLLADEVAPGARFAFLRSRPGQGFLTGEDRAWAQALYAAARRADVPCEMVHLATRGAISPIPWDEVAGAASA